MERMVNDSTISHVIIICDKIYSEKADSRKTGVGTETQIISKEVYVKQPPGFENHNFPEHVFKLKKSLYGLKQAPRAWYERLSNFLLEKNFTRGKVDTTLFHKTIKKDMLICQIYVDDIIFGTTNALLGKEFSKSM